LLVALRAGVKRRAGTAFVTAGILAVLFACGNPLLQEELDCEEAVSVLDKCCPGFAGSLLQCEYTSDCSGTTYPAISEDQSACIRGESCDTLRSSGVCDRAQQARSYTTGGIQTCPLTVPNCTPSEPGPAQVCP
jgi:hypothetical protein